MNIDFGKTAADYARHRAGFPDTLFERLRAFGIGLPGQRVLDVGTGTGSLARGFARRGCEVVGLDVAKPLLISAKRLSEEEGRGLDLVNAAAEATALAANSFDGVSAGQCWHWFDRPRAATELKRVLKPGGWLAIPHFDWLPLPGNVVEATERLILRHNPRWDGAGGAGFHHQWVGDVTLAGFQKIETFSFDLPVFYSHEAWRGRIRASAGIAASLSPDRVAAFDADLRRLLEQQCSPGPLAIPHRCFAVVCHKPGL